MVNVARLAALTEQEFSDIVESTSVIRGKLRVILTDASFVDFWWSTEIEGRFACHWERRHVDGRFFRHDNMPHAQWKNIKTFPKHFHDGDTGEIIESFLAEDPENAVREFLAYAQKKIDRRLNDFHF
jgi:hypothetical protein